MGKGNRVSGARVLSLAAQMRPFFSLLPLEGGAPKGRRLAACNGTPTFAEANPASLRSSAPSRGRGANDFSGNTDSIVAIRDLGLALPPHMSRTSPLSSSVFHAACALSAPAGHLPLEGKAAIREYPLLKRRHTTLVNLSAPQVPSSRAQPRDLYCTVAICTHVPSLKRHLGASFFVFPSLTIYRSARRIPPLRSG